MATRPVQAAGAAAVIVVQNRIPDDSDHVMGGSGAESEAALIPSVLVHQVPGTALMQALGRGEELTVHLPQVLI